MGRLAGQSRGRKPGARFHATGQLSPGHPSTFWLGSGQRSNPHSPDTADPGQTESEGRGGIETMDRKGLRTPHVGPPRAPAPVSPRSDHDHAPFQPHKLFRRRGSSSDSWVFSSVLSILKIILILLVWLKNILDSRMDPEGTRCVARGWAAERSRLARHRGLLPDQ